MDEKKKKMTTSKKQKFVRSRVLIDRETGEEIPMQEMQIEDRDFNFHKVWLEHLLSGFDCIANKKLKLALWIINNLDKENKLVMTQRRIADETRMSYKTVTDTMRALQRCDPPFLVKINSGAYRVNPDVVWKGSHNNRMGVIYNYSNEVIRAQQIDNTAITNVGADVADPATPEDITTTTETA